MPRWTFENKITFGNLLTIIIALVPAIFSYAVMWGTVTQSAEAVKAIPNIETRVSTIETRINIGQKAREDYQAATAATLDKIQTQQLQIIAQTAAIIARLDEQDRTRRQ